MKKLFVVPLSAALLWVSCAKKELQQDDGARLQQAPPTTATLQSGTNFRRCMAEEILKQQIAKDPARGRYLDNLEATIQNLKGNQNTQGSNTAPRTIRVVVHIVSTNPGRVSDAQVKSQIAVLNQDFAKTNRELKKPGIYLAGYDPALLPDCGISFVLDRVIRKQTTVTEFQTYDGIKYSALGGSDAIDPTTRLNIWVGNLGGGLLGYAQFPGGNPATDGLVIHYEAFGTTGSVPLIPEYNLGRTATHEMGHWLNLRHIWGDTRCGNDRVDDTPQQDGPNFGCGTIGQISNCGTRPLKMWMNYMDYSDDRCLYMFTHDQKTRMDATIASARKAYFSGIGSL